MPFKSEAQNRWAHTKAGTEALGGPEKVKEWESATDYKHLPARKGYAKGGVVKHERPNESPAHEAKETPAMERWEKRTGKEIEGTPKEKQLESKAHEAKETPAQERLEEKTGHELYAKGGLVKGDRPHHQSHEMPHRPSIGGHNDGHGIFKETGGHPMFAAGGPVRNEHNDRFYKSGDDRGKDGRFLSTVDRFTGGRKPAGYPEEAETGEKWSKPKGVGQTDPDDIGDCKSLKPVLPHSSGGHHWYGK